MSVAVTDWPLQGGSSHGQYANNEQACVLRKFMDTEI